MPVVRVALPVAAPQVFDYWVPDGLEVSAGHAVRVRLGRRTLVGLVVEAASAASIDPDRLQPVLERVDIPALPPDVLALVSFVAGYYQDAIGMAAALALPPLGVARRAAPATIGHVSLTPEGRALLPARLTRSPAARRLFERLLSAPEGLGDAEAAALGAPARRVLRQWITEGMAAAVDVPAKAIAPALALNAEQDAAVQSILATRGTYAAFLLQGITGSGKSEVYFTAAAQCIAAGGQVLLLVPEINLTPQLESRIAAALAGVRLVTLHSGLSDGVRRANWLATARGDAQLVLGTRLAVFAPMPRLSLIVVDEEHDTSFKQQDGVRYHARDAALWRARHSAIPVVLGSATPSLESYAAADAGRYRRLLLGRRADPRALLPSVRLVPARDAGVRDGICEPLWQALRQRVARGEQSLVFVNRRGYSPSLKCASCTWEAGCPRCSARLVVHQSPASLRCHHCGHSQRVPASCPDCGNVDLLPRGHGTQRLEQALTAALPGARIARVDRDTTRRRGSFAEVRARIAAEEVDVLVGTQMLAKGHDFPKLTLVGVLGADNALYSADFRATERLAALLMQVAGRAGRAALAGEVIVQTDFPQHPVFAALLTHDYDLLARALLDERRLAGLPPFARLALLAAEARDRTVVDRFLADAHAKVRELVRDRGVEVFAPVPCVLARRAGMERGQMLLRSRRAGGLQRVLAALRTHLLQQGGRSVRWAIDVDPECVS